MPLLPQSPTARGALFGLAAFALFSTHDVLIKDLSSRYTAFQIVFYTSLFSFPLLTLIMIREQRETTLRPRHPYWLALRCLGGVVSGIGAFIAIGLLPLSEVYAYIFAAPLIITLLAIPMLGETVRLHRGIAVVVGLIGVLIVLQPGAAPLELGHLAALASAFAGALVSIVTRKIGQEERGVVMVLYPMMTNLILTALVMPFAYVPVSIWDLGLLAVDAVLILIAMSLLVAAYANANAISVAPTQYSQIIWATLFGILLFSEYPEPRTIAGIVLIVLSGVYVLLREAKADVSANTPVSRTRTRIGHAMTLRVGHALRKRRPDP